MITNGSELISRLMACGYTQSSAEDICKRYAAEDENGLESFIESCELGAKR